jgi:NAD(P)-dependent dehydrogenase (short-subunit alcohol dehydrogenase family)
MRGLVDRAVLVTGGASGIGRAACNRLAVEGARVAVVDRNAELVDEVAQALTSARAARVVGIVADVSDESQVRAAVSKTRAELGAVNGLVTSAGIFDGGDMNLLADVPFETFQRTLAVNLNGTFLFCKFALPFLLEGEPTKPKGSRGAIVTIASTAGLRGHGFGSGYTASKGGVVALTRLLAVQYGEKGVRANCICPGATDTPLTGGVYRDPNHLAHVTPRIPLRRVAEPEEIGDVACHLLSDDASYVNGQVIAVDGGATSL